MKKFLSLAVIALSIFSANAAFAADEAAAPAAEETKTLVGENGRSIWLIPEGEAGVAIGLTVGLAIIVFGAAKGISRIGAAAVESMARQPEVAGSISTAMIISAALIEGFTFFALLIPMLKIG